jgi:uncharacterized tellurite resistance protein B-like protein
MIDRIKALFRDRGGRPSAGGAGHGAGEMQLAAAALLVEAATMDQEFDAAERETITRLVCARFGLARHEAEDLLARAERAVAGSTQLLPFTRVVKDRFSYEERIQLMEMLWEVVYADGRLHDYEAHLLRRIGGLIYVPDKERGAARKRVLARLGLADKGAST